MELQTTNAIRKHLLASMKELKQAEDELRLAGEQIEPIEDAFTYLFDVLNNLFWAIGAED